MSSLNYILINSNNLSAPIPEEFGNLASLISFASYENQLSGPIPPSLGKLESVSEILLFSNQLSGQLPPALFNLTNLIDIELDKNYLVGPLPDLCRGKKLEILHLSHNNLNGSMPKTLRDCISLRSLGISYNKMDGDITDALGVYPHL